MKSLVQEMTENHNVSYFKSKGQFQISVAPETFRMFSSGLYSNPIKAIVREYSTNAKDSHVEAGVSRPFDVQLPTKPAPVFMIRDYGTGMSPERVETVYQTYGASTKRETDQATGKFGLGSKSALSYVNSFAVISYYKGKMYKYLVVLNAEGIPELLYDGEPTDTEEPNGLKIQFGVNANDVSRFINEAKDIYAYFEIPPNFLGNCKPEIVKPTYVMEGEEENFKWKIINNMKDDKVSSIIMGSNRYPLGDELKHVRQSGIDYYVEMDLFEPTPSREALTWGDVDIKKFAEMEACVERSIKQKYKKDTKDLTKWEKIHYNCKFEGTTAGDILELGRLYGNVKNYSDNEIINTDKLTIFANSYNLVIESRTINIRQIIKSQRSRNYTVSHGNDVNGVNLKTKSIHKNAPILLILYDVRGLSAVLGSLREEAVIIGNPTNKKNDKDLKYITDQFDQLKIPYETERLSDILKDTSIGKKTAPVKAFIDPTPKYAGIFEYVNNTFSSVNNIAPFDYYVPFDDEKTFTLEKFFKASSKLQPSWYEKRERLVDLKLKYVSYNQIAKELDFENPDVNICYIRPRFVKKYCQDILDWKGECQTRLITKFQNNWLGFICHLSDDYKHTKDTKECYKDLQMLTPDAQHLYHCLYTANTAVWLHHYIHFPFISYIAETIAKHRINSQLSYGRKTNGLRLNLKESESYTRLLGSYEILTSWMFSTLEFTKLYQDWIIRLNEETEALKRNYPYLFKTPEQLLYNSLTIRRPH